MSKLRLHDIAADGATNNQGLFFNSTTGIWTVGDTEKALYSAKGDLLIGTGSGARAKLAVGTNGYVLTADSTQTTGLKWAAAASAEKIALLKYNGTVTTGVGATLLYNDTSSTWTLNAVRASVETAPSGGTVVVDVNINGTTIFTTQANRPSIATATLTSGKVTAINVTSVSPGSYLSVDVDTATSPAANLTVAVVYQ